MAKNVKAVAEGLCGAVMSCTNGNDYCVLKPHSDAIGHVSKVNTPHDCAGRALPYEDCPLPWVHSGYMDASPPPLVEMPEQHKCPEPEILIVNEQFYRTILELITSGPADHHVEYADAVILIAERIKAGTMIPGATAWIGDGA